MWRSDLVSGLNQLFGGLDFTSGIRGWGRVRWGDSFDKVKTAYPQAVEEMRVTGRKLVLASSSGPGRPYQLVFDFDSGHQLESVTLLFSGSQEVADYAGLIEAISLRLGTPVSQTETTTTWQRDDSQFTVSRQPEQGVVVSKSV